MLSVYYHALGSRLELRSAPAVLAPTDVEALPLDEALDILSHDRRGFDQAVWTISRGIPPQGGRLQDPLARYPRELLDVLGGNDSRLRRYEERRREFRRGAHTFGEALDFYARQDGATASDLDGFVKLLRTQSGFSEAVGLVGALGTHADGTPHDIESYLTSLANRSPEARKRAAASLRRLAEEVGLPLPTFLEEYAYAVAFSRTFPDVAKEMTVLPASSVTVQDGRALTTVVTVTALIKTKNLSCVSIGLDPQCWMVCSDAFESSGYLDVDDRKTPRPRAEHRLGRAYSDPKERLIEERVRIVWGTSAQELGSFHNLLNARLRVRDDKFPASVSLDFDLHRCISSRVLWDVRPGGILLDEGYARARQVANGLFRVTVRKTLRFSDRTPYRGGAGWHDLGQLLNLLAPAAMSWWLESEMYNGVCPKLLDLARKHVVPVPTSEA